MFQNKKAGDIFLFRIKTKKQFNTVGISLAAGFDYSADIDTI